MTDKQIIIGGALGVGALWLWNYYKPATPVAGAPPIPMRVATMPTITNSGNATQSRIPSYVSNLWPPSLLAPAGVTLAGAHLGPQAVAPLQADSGQSAMQVGPQGYDTAGDQFFPISGSDGSGDSAVVADTSQGNLDLGYGYPIDPTSPGLTPSGGPIYDTAGNFIQMV